MKDVQQNQKGFTLIEMAIVMMITGVLMGVGFQYLTLYSMQKKYTDTTESIRITQDALYEFYALNGRYPCPADPDLGEGDAAFGIEQCREVAAPRNCPASMPCSTSNSRDANGDGNNDPVMVGAIPFRTLTEDFPDSVPIEETRFRSEHAFDAFGMKLTYGVSEHMTDPVLNTTTSPANSNLGAIRVIDENAISVLDPEASAHYVVLSHGDNSEGAYTRQGPRSSDCLVVVTLGDPPSAPPAGPSPANTPPEKENCDYNDAIFVKGIRSVADNNDYYDDIVFFKSTGLEPLWKRSLVGTASPNESYIYNTNLGNVGVGLPNPAAKLHVQGDLSAEKAVIAEEYCPLGGASSTVGCLDPESIAGTTGMRCPAHQIATGIEDSELICENVFDELPSNSCVGVNEYVSGLRYTNGGGVQVLCETRTAP